MQKIEMPSFKNAESLRNRLGHQWKQPEDGEIMQQRVGNEPRRNERFFAE